VALRPRLIWGPEDTNLVPQLVARARSGQLRLVGDGSNLVDTVYIDNAVDAHLRFAPVLAGIVWQDDRSRARRGIGRVLHHQVRLGDESELDHAQEERPHWNERDEELNEDDASLVSE